VIKDNVIEPSNFRQAMKTKQARNWLKSLFEEHNSLLDAEVYEEIPIDQLPPGIRLLGGRTVFKLKRDKDGNIARFKSRIVVQGFTQQFGIDYTDTYAPVVPHDIVRVVLALATQHDWLLWHLDVKTAFCNAELSEELYMRAPEGLRKQTPDGKEIVWKLKKSLYGLKQSPRNWNNLLHQWLVDYGFKATGTDPCTYVRHASESGEDGLIVVLVYVDDLVCGGPDLKSIEHFKESIMARFAMNDLGELEWLLGMQIKRDRTKRTMEITQTAFVEQLLERFDMQDCKAVGTPCDQVLARVTDGSAGPSKQFMSLVGSELWLAMITHPEMSTAVQSFSRHLQATSEEHFAQAKRSLRYLQGVKHLGIKFSASSCGDKPELIGFSDADWGGDVDTRRSTTGYVFTLAGGPVSWSSRLQPTVALSSAEAEYMAVCTATQQALYLRSLLSELGFAQENPTIIFEDNQACIALSVNRITSKRSKHIAIKYHFIREKIENREIELKYISTEHQLADIMTKPLSKPRTLKLREMVRGYKAVKLP
jgi:hypothetical protein